MGLTDSTFSYVVTAAAVVAFVATLVLWSKVARTGLLWFLGRLSLLLVTNLLVLTAVGVAVNNWGEFYTSWGDLMGTSAATTQIVANAKTTPVARPTAETVTGKISLADIEQGGHLRAGSRLLYRTFTGAASGLQGHIWLVIPREYINALAQGQHTSLPVVQFLPGYPGQSHSWLTRMELNKFIIANGKPMIAVITDTNIVPGFDGECMNVPGGPQLETWVSHDVPSYVSSLLGVDPHGWSIAGYSTGAWCAAMLGIRDPHVYTKAVGIAGYYNPMPSLKLPKSVQTKLIDEYDLVRLIKYHHPATPLYLVDASVDKFGHHSLAAFLAAVDKEIPVTHVVINATGHNFNSWKPVMPQVLRWLTGV